MQGRKMNAQTKSTVVSEGFKGRPVADIRIEPSRQLANFCFPNNRPFHRRVLIVSTFLSD